MISGMRSTVGLFRRTATPAFRVGSLQLQPRLAFSSIKVSASMVQELRSRSGAPMMDCKKALMAEGVEGNIDKAIDYLRVKGLAKASANVRTALHIPVWLIIYYSGLDD